MPTRETVPPLRSEQTRARQLVVSKRRATLLLAVVTIGFLVVTAFGGNAPWAGYLQAAMEASMVGGLADWFAVTALFRRPLGLPIPHTAIIVERKDQFAVTLGEFMRDSFLTPEVVVDRVRNADVVGRFSRWLSDPEHAGRVAAEIAGVGVAAADLFGDADVHRAIEDIAARRLEALNVAPLVGRALRFVLAEGLHDEPLDAALRGLDGYLDEHRLALRRRLDEQAPWWLPGRVEKRIFERLVDGVRSVLRAMADDPSHELRVELEAGLTRLAVDLETSAIWRARGEQIKNDLLAHPQMRQLVATTWRDTKRHLRQQAGTAESALMRWVTEAILAAGGRLGADPVVRGWTERAAEQAVGYLVEHFDGEIASLVSGTIARWDGEETARRLELLLGPDLQYIRINGTVFGALAGLAIHLVARLLG